MRHARITTIRIRSNVRYSIRLSWTDKKYLRSIRKGRTGTIVNVYVQGRSYGGPEEGGWYYDSYEYLYHIKGLSTRHARYLAGKVPAEKDQAVMIEGSIDFQSTIGRPYYC